VAPPGLTVRDLLEEDIAAARRRAPADRLRDGLALFDRVVRIMADGVRHEQPGATPETILQAVRKRLQIARSLERQ
jgi:hypothetical protein